MVTALGMEHAAKAVQVADFSDVEAGRWSAGYIAVAAGQGIILGILVEHLDLKLK